MNIITEIIKFFLALAALPIMMVMFMLVTTYLIVSFLFKTIYGKIQGQRSKGSTIHGA